MKCIFKNIIILFIGVIFLFISVIGVAQQCNIIYVTPTGTGNGTSTNPTSLANAFNLVSSTNNIIWLAVGNYAISNELPMISGATLEGGFDPITWIKTNSQQSIIYRDASNVALNPNRIVAVECTNISNFNIHDLAVTTADAVGAGVSNCGLHISNSSDYTLARLYVTSANATDGVGGSAGVDGSPGTSGTTGLNGDEDGSCCTAPGSGGVNFWGGNGGGNGGAGASQGQCAGLFCSGGSAPDGSSGQNGGGANGGAGNVGGAGVCQCASGGCDAGPANHGKPGADGANGLDGTDGADGIVSYGVYFTPGDGQSGAQGMHGGGGGGGGGGGSQGCLMCPFGIDNNGSGAGGGGGGSGGEGGYGASGGTGGGGSFAIYIDANGTNSFLKDATLNSGIQGMGGTGGTPGGNGGNGGAKGIGGIGAGSGLFGGCPAGQGDIGNGGDGGKGGAGGKGGNGGNGVPGASLPLSENTNGTAIAQSDMKASVEPAVYMLNTGCTFHDIFYTTNATGIIQWFFDGGSLPLSATGDSVKTQYYTQGRHSTTLVVDGVPYMFTDFTGIFSDGTPYLPTITGPDTVCPGNTGNFGISFDSVFSPVGYNWNIFHPGSTTPAKTDTLSSFSYIFPDTSSANYAGTYMLTLQTKSQCCGWSKPDTFFIQVVPYLKADVFVSASAAAICNGETINLFAIPLNGGNMPTYQWNLNGANTGITTGFFSSSTFNNGDVVTCIMTSSYACPLNSPAISLPFTITVNPLPTAGACATIGNFLGFNTSFSAAPSGGTAPYTYSWDFGDGGIDTAATATHLYGGTGIFTYSVSVTDSNGCTGVCTNTIDVVIAPLVNAGFDTTQIIVCGSTTVTFTDTSLGLPSGNPTNSWLWNFGDGTTDSVQNPTHIYTVPGTYSVTLTAGNGALYDTYFAANIVVVKTVPTANISYLTDTVCFPLGAQFFDISPGAASWNWNFGDGDSLCCNIQNPYHTYDSAGNYTVTLAVTSTDTCTAIGTDTIYVLPAPLASFTLSDTVICSADSIMFSDNSLPNVVIWNWSFGDGSGDAAQSPAAHHYLPGQYFVYLQVENNLGCKDDTLQMLNVLLSPVAIFSLSDDSICSDELITFNNTSTDATSWNWTFGDGSNDSVNFLPFPHFYNNITAQYPIQLAVENINGCKDTLTDTVTVLLTPVAGLTISDTVICAGQTITFTDNSSSDASQWLWDFGDGGSDTAVAPSAYTYDNAGIYTVSLTVENNFNCNDDTVLSNAVNVKPQPDALFNPDTTEILFPDNDIALTNLSTTSNGSPITSWLWNFGNNTFDSSNYNATAVYPDSGNYTIILYAMYEDKCIDSMKVDVRVVDIEAIYFCNSFTPNDDGINDEFYIFGNNIPELKLYIFNRWGDVIYESPDNNPLSAQGKFAGWDGKVKGKRVPDGVYPFKVEYKLNSTKNKVHTKIGSVLVLGKR